MRPLPTARLYMNLPEKKGRNLRIIANRKLLARDDQRFKGGEPGNNPAAERGGSFS